MQTTSLAMKFTTEAGGVCAAVAGNEAAIPVVSFMAAAMELSEHPWSEGRPCLEPVSRLQVYVQKEPLRDCLPGAGKIYENGSSMDCHIGPAVDLDLLATQMIWLSPFFVRSIESRGGALIHGALAERNGSGVIFAGPGGIGKTTVSKRLPHPWRSLSDDMTLIECDANGDYRAHPWPTWSRFMWGGDGGTWKVQKSVPLRAIFILEQAVHTRLQQTGNGQAVMLLQEVADQASFFAYDSIDRNRARRYRIERFNSICAISQKVPVPILHTSLSSPFADAIKPFIEPIRTNL
jgi:SynChlorMet cassette protein ScmC